MEVALNQSLLLTQHFLDKQGIKKGLQKDFLPIIIGQRIFKARQKICTWYLCTSVYLLLFVLLLLIAFEAAKKLRD